MKNHLIYNSVEAFEGLNHHHVHVGFILLSTGRLAAAAAAAAELEGLINGS